MDDILTPALDTAVETEPEVETPVEPSEPASDGAPSLMEPSVEPSEGEPLKDALPNDVAKLLRELRSSETIDRAALKSLQSAYFGHKSYAELFPQIEDARIFKATLDSVGGLEGLNQLQESVSTLENLDVMAEEGNPELIKAMASESPEGFRKLVPVALEEMQRLDPRGYDELLRPAFVEAIQGTGLVQSVQRTLQAMQAGYQDFAIQELNGILKWVEGLATQQSQASQMGVSANRQSEPANVINQQDEIFQQQLSNSAMSWLQERSNAALKGLSQGYNLSPEAVKDLTDGILAELDRTFANDAIYQSRMSALIRQHNLDHTLNFMKANIDKVLQKTANAVWTRRYGGIKPAVATKPAPAVNKPAAASAPSTSSVIRVPQRPADEQIDNTKTDLGMLMRHQAVLKTGKRVSWPF